ncbi:hypothetical protein [Staphylospora marina]|uniref:hypothetical protein n=1 Tax=Staphylospora marina TaxID=2490858 RepID=UPI000F5BC779|nr:hypothetical protein [Staphylospora marina]
MRGRRWTPEEDRLLREEVLQAIMEGGTQIEAFEKVGKKLGRTPGACGFRWNAVLRRQDPDSYAEAKKKRVFRQLRKSRMLTSDAFPQVIQWMRQAREDWTELKKAVGRLSEELSARERELERARKENRRLREEKSSYDWYETEVKKKYADLLQLIRSIRNEESPWDIRIEDERTGAVIDTGDKQLAYNKDEV